MMYLYTARARFNKEDNSDTIAWNDYVKWSKLTQLTELVSLDTSLNEGVFEPDRTSEIYWENTITDNLYETGFYKTLEYVLGQIKDVKKFNLLTVVINPEADCSLIQIADYDFLGYDLLDQYYDTSALTNCGGFDETFLPGDLNCFGLIDDYEKAYSIRKSLKENNPEEEHADTNVIAVWRHGVIGW